MLDIYVVSLSASWISDSTLTTLMGRVPARCILLLEDLDAAFTRSVNRVEGQEKERKEGPAEQNANTNINGGGGLGRGRGRRTEQLSDVNTLSLSGLLNALDGVAAAEGRLLFALVILTCIDHSWLTTLCYQDH
jgi:mitochondrial chaperone BCS1